jgi:glycine/D-amino acid oxidase-like deaminating enzyme
MYCLKDSLINEFGFAGVKHLIQNKGEGQIDTGRMMKTLVDRCHSAGIQILNGANIDHFNESNQEVEIRVSNTQHSISIDTSEHIKAKRILICTNGFAKKFLPDEDIQPARAQVLITEPIENLNVKGSFHFENGFYYFRNVGNRLLFGGGRNLDFNVEATEEFGITTKIQSALDKYLNEMILPGINFNVEMRWSGIMGLGNHKTPIVKKIGKNIFCAVRMGGMGIAIGSQVGEDAANLILESF